MKGIYIISNKITGQKYVGQSYNLNRREYQHFLTLKNGTHDNPFLQASFVKYGEDNFEFFIIDDSAKNQEELNDLEEYYMLKYGYPDRNKCYNLQLPSGVPSRCYEIYKKQEEICNDYQSDMTTVELLNKYGIGYTLLYHILKENNIPTGLKGRRLDLYDSSKEIISHYVDEGLTASEISKKFNTSPTMILKILRANDIKPEEYKNYRHEIWDNAEEVCRLYEEKQSLLKVAETYNVSISTIRNILNENNISIKESKRTDINEEDVCRDYLKGLSSLQLAEKYSCAKGTILNILKRNNIVRRTGENTQFKKGSAPHNKGKSKIELKGGVDYIKECILNDMTTEDICKDVGYKNFSNISAFLTKQGTSYTKLKMELGKQHNSSGYFRVTKEKNNQRRNATWRYVYSDNGKRKSITSTDINKLEEKVKSKGLEWRKL